MELFDHDLPVYLLHNDDSETTAEDRKQITEHEGIFGIEKDDWKNERKLRSMQAELADNDINKEAQLLYGSSDKYGMDWLWIVAYMVIGLICPPLGAIIMFIWLFH